MTTRKVPKHLRKYTIEQNYDSYTAINHAVWRYVMRQNHHTLKDLAHEAYIEGLQASGISTEKIPDVNEMNRCLAPFGWGAATIDGFIPGVAFFEFQANGILPVVAEIRKLENIQYTPAPDMIHEAAGHAPILCNEKYSEYVKLFGEIGKKAIATKEEHDVFEAVRHYSNLLEKGEATETEIANAKKQIDEKSKLISGVSEAEKIGRLYWWTVEYGLIGSLEEPKIYGAGLLSSVSEGGNILSPDVKKVPFDLKTIINTGFDITKPQPQLFVCNHFEQLIEGLKEFAKEMAFMKGGSESLEKAIQSANVATAVYSSGLQVTGVIQDMITDEENEPIYIKTKGATALAHNDKELSEHGTQTHKDGFGAPVGKLKGINQPLETLSDSEMESLGIAVGQSCELHFESGVEVKGTVEQIVKEGANVILISFKNCLVKYRNQVLFEPNWGMYDMAVGEKISSVFAGAADGETYYPNEESSSKITHNQEQTELDDLYQTIRNVREGIEENTIDVIEKVSKDLNDKYPNDWLLKLEIIEILHQQHWLPKLEAEILSDLQRLSKNNRTITALIENGLKIYQTKI
ncbi:aromatic amino acid hydroxylase [Alkalihalobacterium alkalinitrilicum]|uniref:aromatic amino acid hydroxylase n=1 Tax=Alkalihalobacterium alkalinitrilicum TaxID=427920 RepID=UPI0009954670|nr:aromatic amino acid hydroxylase [Alkalihalobacterium alkalinitrilicum]